MFTELTILSPQADAATRFRPSPDWVCAAGLTAIPVTKDEVEALAEEYAIVFSNTSPSFPMAVLGADGRNGYLNAQGQWDAKHLPARLAIYPFGSKVIDGKTHLVRDAGAPQFADPNGKALYDGQGQGTPLMSEITTSAARVHLGFVAIAALVDQIDRAGLLGDAHLDVNYSDGSDALVGGFLAVNPEALAGLDPATTRALEDSGAMALVKLHQASLRHIDRALA